MINTITILGGYSRSGIPEAVERIDLKMGNVVSIVGPTGSGKTTLIVMRLSRSQVIIGPVH